MNRNVTLSIFALLVAIGGGWWWLALTKPAMSSDSFQFVIATYQATQRQDIERLEQISQQLESQNTPTKQFAEIDKIIDVALGGDWNLASKQAFTLMKQQRR